MAADVAHGLAEHLGHREICGGKCPGLQALLSGRCAVPRVLRWLNGVGPGEVGFLRDSDSPLAPEAAKSPISRASIGV